MKEDIWNCTECDHLKVVQNKKSREIRCRLSKERIIAMMKGMPLNPQTLKLLMEEKPHPEDDYVRPSWCPLRV